MVSCRQNQNTCLPGQSASGHLLKKGRMFGKFQGPRCTQTPPNTKNGWEKPKKLFSMGKENRRRGGEQRRGEEKPKQGQ